MPATDFSGRGERARATSTPPAARNPAVVTATTTIAGAVSAPRPTTNATPDTAPNTRQTTPASTVTTLTTSTLSSPGCDRNSSRPVAASVGAGGRAPTGARDPTGRACWWAAAVFGAAADPSLDAGIVLGAGTWEEPSAGEGLDDDVGRGQLFLR